MRAVRMLLNVCDHEARYDADVVYELSEERAQYFLDHGMAVLADDAVAPPTVSDRESAAVEPIERAVASRPRKRVVPPTGGDA